MDIQEGSNSSGRELNIRWVNPKTLRPDKRNARHHPKDQIRKLQRSYAEFGFTNPLIVDEEGSVICGHGRLEAWLLQNLELVPVIVISDLTEAQRRAYILMDNRLAEDSGWSKELLRSELKGLLELGYDVELTGFDTVEIDTLLSFDDEDGEPATGCDGDRVELPDECEPLSRLGDHWIIDVHHLIVGDARDSLVFEELLGEVRAEVVFTDPPFGRATKTFSGQGRAQHRNFLMGAGETSALAFEQGLIRPAMRNIARFSQPGAIGYVCSDWRCLKPFWDAAEGVFVEPKNLITWAKTNAGLGSFYRQQTEFIIPFLVSRGPVINNMALAKGKRHRSTLWTYPGCNVFRRGRMEDLADHPSVKPRKLVADALLDTSRPGGVVLDPFLGSGTTLAAAHVVGRVGYGLELDPRYCDVILRRLHKLTKTMPRLADGTPLDEVARERGVEWQGG